MASRLWWRRVRTKRGRRRLAVLAVLAALAALLAAGLFPQEPLRWLAERQMRAALGSESRLGGLHVVPATLVVEVRDMVVDTGAIRFELARGRVDLPASDLLRLLPGREGAWTAIRVEALELESPRVAVRASAPAAGAGGGLGLPDLVVERLELTSGHVTYSDPDPAAGVRLEGLEVRGSLGRGRLVVDLREGAWAGAPALAIGPVRAEGSVSPRLDVDLASFTARLGRSRIEARGPLGRPSAWNPRLALAGTVDLSDLASLGAPALAGSLEAAGRLDGPPESATLDLEIHGSALEMADWLVSEARARLRYRAAGPSDAAWTLLLPAGRVEGEVRLRKGAVDGGLRFADVGLESLPGALRASLGGWRGRTSGRLGFEGDPGASLQVTGEAEARLESADHEVDAVLSLSGPVVVPERRPALSWTLQANGVAAPAVARAPLPPGAARFEEARLDARGTVRGAFPPAVSADLEGALRFATAEGSTSVTVRGTVRSERSAVGAQLEMLGLGGTLRLSAETAGTVVRRLELTGDALSLAPLGLAGTARVALEATGPWPRLGGTAQVAVAEAGWRGVRLGDVSLEAESRAGDVRATLAMPAVAVRGEARLPVAESPALSARLHFEGSRIEALAPLLPEDTPLSGAVTGRVELTAPLDRPTDAEAEAHVESLRVESGPWSLASRDPFVLRARDGRLSAEGLTLLGPGLRLGVSGSVSTEARSALDLQVDAALDLGAFPPPAGLTWTGDVEARVSLSGGLDRPRPSGFVLARTLAVEGGPLPPVQVPEVRVDLAPDEIQLQRTSARVAGGEVSLEGRVPLAAFLRSAQREEGRPSDEDGASLAVSFRSVDVAALVERLRADRTSPLTGRLSGRLDAGGRLTSVQELRADLHVTPEAIVAQDLPLAVSPVRVRIERGEALLESTTVAAEGSELTVGGRLDLERRTVDASAHGELKLRAISPLLPEAAVSGRAVLDLAVRGPLAGPETKGSLEVHEGSLRLRALPQALTALEARVLLDERGARIEEASGALGGGRLTLSGMAALSGGALSGIDLVLTGRDVGLRYPEGLRSRLDADLTLSGKPGAFTLAGNVKAGRGLYDLDLALEQSLLATAPEVEESPLLRSVGLDLRVETASPILIRNNLARLDATGSLSLLGDLLSPAPVGRLDLRSGGKVFIQQREFVISSGRIAYAGTWDPEISLKADTLLRGVDLGNLYGRQDVRVTVSLEGSLYQPRATFSSVPGGYTEPEIVTMIATNRARSEALASGAWVAGEQAALLLTGRLTRGLSSGLRGLGLDEVTIQPELLARETNPGARFTFGKQLTDQLRLVYSLSLNQPESRFVEVDLEPGRDLSLLAQRRDDGSVTVGGGQRLRFLGPPRRPAYREPRTRLREVKLEASGDEPLARSLLKVKAGDRVSEWTLQDDAERMRERLRSMGHIEAEVTVRTEGDTAVFRVAPGPRFDWRAGGMADPPDLTGTIEDALFEEDALARGRARMLETLHGRGHLEAAVDTRTLSTGDRRTLVFTASPGPRLRVEPVLFPGATVLSAGRLLQAAGGAARLLSDPEGARRAIREAYRGRHHLAAEVSAPQVTRAGESVRIVVPVDEGPPARVRSVRFVGASLPGEDLARAAQVPENALFDQEQVLQAVDRLRGRYFGLGYPGVRITPKLEPAGPDLDLVLEVSEGPRTTVESIEITGARATSEPFVRRTLGFAAGDPLDPRRLATGENRLLALGTFSRVAVTRAGEDPARVRVELEEEARLSAGYQARYNDEKGLSGVLDGEVRNLLGRGLTVGALYSRGRDDEEIRGSVLFPSLGFLGNLTGSVFRTREEDLLSEDSDLTVLQRQRGFELQASRPLPRRWSLLYGYSFKTSKVTSDLDEFSTSTRIASLDVSLLRDTRDNPLDARRGRFWSVNLQLAPRLLASDLDFAKGMAQIFVSRPLGASLTWAQGYRLGLAHVFSGERLIFSERFRAGGGNSVRGFLTDSLGPRDFFGEPAGGQAVIVVNQELRYMLPVGIGGVVFWDAGEVFAKAADLSLDLQHALGVGLRWDSPVGLLRVDVGFPLSRPPGEKPYRLFFSLGQAF